MTDSPSASPPDRRAGNDRRVLIRFFVIFAVLLAVDLVVKDLAFDRVAGTPVSLARDAEGQLPPIPAHDLRVVIPKVLGLHLTLNEGAVFGLGQGGRWIFVIFSIAATGFITTIFLRSDARAWPVHLALASVLAGALGNLYDRLFIGAVRDMLLLFPGVRLPFGWSWPGGAQGLYPWIFNIADVCLVVGLVVLIFFMYRQDRKHAEESDA